MAHEITETDAVGVVQVQAWHNLATVWPDAVTPVEGCRKLKIDWPVETWMAVATKESTGDEIEASNYRFNVRGDTQTILGSVGKDYQPVQNIELAEFCEALAKQDDKVKIESAGTIRGGQKIWFLLKGESFKVRKKDEMRPYICVSNGHDGKTAINCDNTEIRAVCSNTLHMIVPETRGEGQRTRFRRSGCSFTHVGDVKEKIEQARQALGLYQTAMKETRKVIDRLVAKEVTKEEVQKFFLECYTRDFGAIPLEPVDKKEQRKKDRAMDACNLVFDRFDKELNIAGATAWNAYNAYTGWMQNDYGHSKSREWSKLVGTDADRGVAAFELALAMAV